MELRYVAALSVLALIFAGIPANAQERAVVTEVQAGDDDANRGGSTVQINVVFVDADGDGSLDAVNPDETVYLNFGGDNRVSFGDIRLTGFLTYPSGTAVNYTNRDLGLTVETIDGWFARDGQGNWYIDVDDDGTVDVGELALQVGEGIHQVQRGDGSVGTSVEPVQDTFTPAERFIYVDRGPTGVDWADRFYLDLDGSQQANPGELRFEASRLGIDDSPTGREFQAAIDQLEANTEELENDLKDKDRQTETRLDKLESDLAATEADLAQAQADLETKDNWLLALGLVDLVAVAGVGYWVYTGHSQHGTRGEED